MKRQAFIRLALSALALCVAAGAQARTTKLRFAHAGPETASRHLAALEFVRLEKERNEGTLEVAVYPGSQLGNDSTVLGAVRGGTINIMMAGSGNFSGLSSKLDGLDIPFLFRDPAHAYATVDGEMGQRLAKELPLRKHGMTVVEAFDPAPFRTIVGEPLRQQDFVAKNGPELLNAVDAIK